MLRKQYSVNTLTHSFNDPLSGTTGVSRYQKGKTYLDFTEARDSEWQWHRLGRMQVCISLQTDNHASTQPLSFYRPDALPAAQPTASKHCSTRLNHSELAEITDEQKEQHCCHQTRLLGSKGPTNVFAAGAYRLTALPKPPS